MTLSEELQWRGFTNQTTFKDISELDKEKRTFYFGVDPSADSMQIGNLAAAMMCRVFMKHGYKAIMLVGGATGMIGDPDGKSQERDLKTKETIEHNKQAIAAQYQQVFADEPFTLVDNYDWFNKINFIDFLRNVGKHVPMRTMVNREFVQSRLSEDGEGISYAEFSYSLIQGYDFVHLHREYGVTLQVSGADQWGNSIAGVDLIRRIEGGEAHVYTVPLIVNKTTGKKFGKSEDGAVWLDKNKTSVYRFYQFWLNVDDKGVEEYLKIYTELPKEKINQVLKDFQADPSARIAQRALAYEVTKIVHGAQSADAAVKATALLFGDAQADELAEADVEVLVAELPLVNAAEGQTIVECLVDAGLAASKGEATRLLQQGGVKLNGQKQTAASTVSTHNGILLGYALLQRGKNKFALIKV
jgi:tyrosyl-tRNA synthetase